MSVEEISMNGYAVTVIFEATSDKIKEMQAVITDVYLPSIRESGMREYRWYRSHQKPDDVALHLGEGRLQQANPNEFLLFMTWDTEDAFKAHVNTPHVQKAEADFVSQGILIKEAPESYWEYITP
jgi:quinol monooxygenase YgiN